MSFGKALYFPSIQFQDDNWVKLGLLYWDGLKRIVPSGYVPTDSPFIRELVSQDLIENINPRDGKKPYVEGAAEEFMPTLEQMLEQRQDRLTTKNFIAELEKPERGQNVDIRKMDARVVEILSSSHLATIRGDSVLMDPRLAGFYMVCLAGYISEKQEAPLVTDSFEMETIGTYFQHSRISTDSPRDLPYTDNHLARLLLPVPRPADLANLSAKRLVEFHEKYQAERTQLRKAMENICEEAGKLEDTAARRDYLESRRNEIKSSLADQRLQISSLGLGTVDSLASISVPAGLGVLGTALAPVAPIFMPLLGALGVTLAILNWKKKSALEKRLAAKNCDWHYLLTLEKEFNTLQIATDSQEWYRQIVVD